MKWNNCCPVQRQKGAKPVDSIETLRAISSKSMSKFIFKWFPPHPRVVSWGRFAMNAGETSWISAAASTTNQKSECHKTWNWPQPDFS